MSFTLARHEVGSVEAFMGPALRFSPAAQTQGSPSGSHFVFLNLGNNNNNITLCSISYRLTGLHIQIFLSQLKKQTLNYLYYVHFVGEKLRHRVVK